MSKYFTFPDGTTVRQRLFVLQANGSKEFATKLNPGVENVLGLRVPDLRKLAKEIVKTNATAYLSSPGGLYMEERMLHGMVLGLIPIKDIDIYLEEVSGFVHGINSWSVCDTFTFSGQQKFIDNHAEKIFKWLKSWLDSEAVYEVRFGVVMLLKYFINDTYVDKVLALLTGIRHNSYYISMAVAWTISVVLVKYPEKGMAWLRSKPVDRKTIQRAIQKSIESCRISPELKDELRDMRKLLL